MTSPVRSEHGPPSPSGPRHGQGGVGVPNCALTGHESAGGEGNRTREDRRKKNTLQYIPESIERDMRKVAHFHLFCSLHLARSL